jgi:hypothetical protein
LIKIVDHIIGALNDGIAPHEAGERSKTVYGWPDLAVRHPIANC